VRVKVSICKIKISSLFAKTSCFLSISTSLEYFGFVEVQLNDSWSVFDTLVDEIECNLIV